ncbi:MAG TPA: hypothetical protein VGP16_05670, partial [Asanoa sp.]|nr:hypothetical protein [Asanoa sp.]
MYRLTSDNAARISRIASATLATAVIGGALALAAPSAGATPTSGTVTAWGENGDGEANVPAAAQSGVTQIAAGDRFALALKTDGSVIGWGENFDGQTNIPAAAQSGVVAIDAESTSALALKADGSLVHWGTGAAPPTGLTGITQIAATNTGGMVLKSDHTIQAFSDVTASQIADVPAALQGHAVSIAAGNAFGVAVTDTGSVTAWGSNFYRQTDVPVAAQSGVVKVVAMDSGAAAVKSDGSVVTWGSHTKVGATPAAAMSGVVDVAIGYDSAVALKSDGSLVAWGPGNDYGEQDIPAVAGYRATSLVEGGHFAMTLHAPLASGPPVINGTPPPAELGQPYDFTVSSTGTFSQVTAGTLPAGLSMDSTGRITGTPAKAGRTTVTVTSTTSLGSATAPMTITVQPAHSTNLQFTNPPASVQTGALESDQYVRSFAERYNQTLASNLTVGGTTIPAGTKVNVYYVHDDHVGSDNVAHTLTGSEWFGTKVLATATSTADLQATTP